MNEEYLKYMTQEKLLLRRTAVENGFRDNNIDAAIKAVMVMAQETPFLFKFYRPRPHSIEALLNSEIFMCRPSSYEDIGDNEYIPDIKSIIKLYVEEVRKEQIPSTLLNDSFYQTMIDKMNANPKFSDYKQRIKDDFLTACITENFDEKMWTEYAQNGEGFCALYDTNQIIVESQKLGYFFYPVRYVESRKDCQDIVFSANEYGDGDQAYDSYKRKAYLSCLTKDILPYSSEGEWRMINLNPGLPEGKKGKNYPFIKPFIIIAGENIGTNPEIEESLIDASKQLGIELIKASDYNNSR